MLFRSIDSISRQQDMLIIGHHDVRAMQRLRAAWQGPGRTLRIVGEKTAVIPLDGRVSGDPDGLVALQFITCPDARYGAFRRGVDFIQKHIFPGSLLLSLNRVNDQLARAGGFVLHGVDDFGPDYARTLRLWRENFLARLDAVRALGFDQIGRAHV